MANDLEDCGVPLKTKVNKAKKVCRHVCGHPFDNEGDEGLVMHRDPEIGHTEVRLSASSFISEVMTTSPS